MAAKVVDEVNGGRAASSDVVLGEAGEMVRDDASRQLALANVFDVAELELQAFADAACADAVRWMPMEMMLRTRRSASTAHSRRSCTARTGRTRSESSP